MAFKSRKTYSISRNAYGIHIRLLDGTDVDFTLSPVSTGQECLDRVSQVLDLDESYIFGLQYYDRTDQLRWIDLEKGLRKQLDRRSSMGARGPEVYFRVRFFPTDMSILQQEVSKYLIYLQLKESVLNGSLECSSADQAALLASFSVQAEIEDHDEELHTKEYLSSFVLFPPSHQSSSNVTDLCEKVVQLHRKHKGMSQATAELSYIRLAQQLKEYGHDGCLAFDEDANRLEVGACYVGIYVKHANGMPTVYFKWPDIFSIKYKKSRLELEVQNEVIQFEMSTKEAAEYLYSLVISQHHFYRLQTVKGVKLRGVGMYFKTQFEANRYSRAFSSRQSSLARKKTLSRSGIVAAAAKEEENGVQIEEVRGDSMEMTTFKEANGTNGAPSLEKIEETEFAVDINHVAVVEKSDSDKLKKKEKSVSPALSYPDTDDELDTGSGKDAKVGVDVPDATSHRIAISPTRTTLAETLQNRLDSEEYLLEYDSIPKKFPDRAFVTLPFSEIKSKNRFKDIMPYDDTRVRLNPENNRMESDYINANHVSLEVDGTQHFYIASQGPLASTAADFWQMIWESEARLIVMVTAEIENNRIKCYRYWPSEGGDNSEVTHGQYEITSAYFNDTGTTITRGFTLKHTPTDQSRTVWHLQYIGWPDHGVPKDPQTFLAFIDEINTLRRHANNTSDDPNLEPPTVVHCSAGVGRTGVTIMMELLLKILEKSQSVDIPDILRALRSQRMALVQTPVQYKFCYQALLYYLSHSSESNRLI